MDWKVICEVGIKILAATAAGAIVFVGINKSISKSKEKKKKKKIDEQNGNAASIFMQTQYENQQLQSVDDDHEESQVVSSMRAAQNTFGKVFTFIQSLTAVTENLSSIFNGDSGCTNSQPYCQNPWSYQPPNSGEVRIRRTSPFIMEVG